MAREMTEEFRSHIACHFDKSLAGDPARDPPEEIVGSHAQYQDSEGKPWAAGALRALRQDIDEEFYAVLRAYRARDGTQHGQQDHRVRYRTPTRVSPKKP
jgi:hypothetical protein